MTTLFDASRYEKATVYFETREVHLEDGKILPITNMLDKKGSQTEDWAEACIIQAGEGDCWVNLRLLD